MTTETLVTVRISAARDFFNREILEVETPYTPEAVVDWRAVPGRRWDAARKVNILPVRSRYALWDLLLKHFPGATALGPKGPFVVARALSA